MTGTIIKEITLTRKLNATPDVVFKMWTDPVHLAKWWGPAGFSNPTCELDLRPGGMIRICMHAPQMGFPNHWMDGVFHEIVQNEKLVFSSMAFDDGHGGHNLVVHNTVTFEEEGSGTRLVVHAAVIKATPEVAQALAGMNEGWSQSLDKLENATNSRS